METPSGPVYALAHATSGALASAFASYSTQDVNAFPASLQYRLPRYLKRQKQRQQRDNISLDEELTINSTPNLAPWGDNDDDDNEEQESSPSRRAIDSFLFFGTYSLLRGSRASIYMSGALPALEELSLGLLSAALAHGGSISARNMLADPTLFSLHRLHKLIKASMEPKAVEMSPSGRVLAAKAGAVVAATETRFSLPMSRENLYATLHTGEALLGNIFRGYYGSGASFVKNAIEPGLTIALEQILACILLPATDGETRRLRDIFVLAVLAKVATTLAMYPFHAAARARAKITYHHVNSVAIKSQNQKISIEVKARDHNVYDSESQEEEEEEEEEKEEANLIQLSDNENTSVVGGTDNHTRSCDSEHQQDGSYNSTFSTIAHIYRTEGASALYAGVGPELLRAVVAHACLMVSKDLVHRVILRAILAASTFFAPDATGSLQSPVDKTVGASAASETPVDVKTVAAPIPLKVPTVKPPPPIPRIIMMHTGRPLPRPEEIRAAMVKPQGKRTALCLSPNSTPEMRAWSVQRRAASSIASVAPAAVHPGYCYGAAGRATWLADDSPSPWVELVAGGFSWSRRGGDRVKNTNCHE